MTAPEAQAGSAPDLDVGAGDDIYGPQFPDERDLYRAQDRPLEADQAGCSEAEYQQLVLERQQTELAYLAGDDRSLEREAGPEPEAELVSGDPWKPCIDAARAASEAEAWVPDYGASDALWMRVEVPPAAPEPEPEAEL